jgi:hypothetical protein
MRCSYGQSWRKGDGCDGRVEPVDWDAAMALRVPGDSAWRLPTKEELDSIVEPDCKKPAINEDVFPDTALMAYWSSTPSGPSYAWHVNFRWEFPPGSICAAINMRFGSCVTIADVAGGSRG